MPGFLRCSVLPKSRGASNGLCEVVPDSLNSFTPTKKAPTFEFTGRNDENGANLDDVIGLIADLKKIIIEQGNTIKN
jgi:hypothetical protein